MNNDFRTVKVVIRFDNNSYETIKECARIEHRSMGELVRHAALEYIENFYNVKTALTNRGNWS